MNRRAGAGRASRRRVRAALGVLPLAVLVVLTLTGCDPLQAGSAAVVGSNRITENQVDKDAQSVVAALTRLGGQVPDTAALLRAEVEFRVVDQLVGIAAQRQGISVTQGQIDTLIARSGGRSQLENQLVAQSTLWLPPGQLDALAREYLEQQQLLLRLAPGGSTAAQTQALNVYITKIAAEVGVAVSPRYGSWDATTLRIGGSVNDLSAPASGGASGVSAPTPSASPSTG